MMNKNKKPSKKFVKEMEKMYPQGAVITPTKTKVKTKPAVKPKKGY